MLDDRIISAKEVALKLALWTVILTGLEYLFDRPAGEIFTRVYWLIGGGLGIYLTAQRRAHG